LIDFPAVTSVDDAIETVLVEEPLASTLFLVAVTTFEVTWAPTSATPPITKTAKLIREPGKKRLRVRRVRFIVQTSQPFKRNRNELPNSDILTI
jgi:hypothetical protein